ncbi:MAG: hypothetical protein AAF408_14170 [Pseudomonadota bacterium]
MSTVHLDVLAHHYLQQFGDSVVYAGRFFVSAYMIVGGLILFQSGRADMQSRQSLQKWKQRIAYLEQELEHT